MLRAACPGRGACARRPRGRGTELGVPACTSTSAVYPSVTMERRPCRQGIYCVMAALLALGVARAAAPEGAAPPVVHPRTWPQPRPALPSNADLEARIDALLARMTPAQKVGQLIQADIG